MCTIRLHSGTFCCELATNYLMTSWPIYRVNSQHTAIARKRASNDVALAFQSMHVLEGRLKMREWKNREQIAGVENAGVDKYGKPNRQRYGLKLLL